MAAVKPRTFRVLIGLNYGDVRREPGDVADDIPPRDVTWLLDQGIIEPVKTTEKAGD